jgi:hypothetical protein
MRILMHTSIFALRVQKDTTFQTHFLMGLMVTSIVEGGALGRDLLLSLLLLPALSL